MFTIVYPRFLFYVKLRWLWEESPFGQFIPPVYFPVVIFIVSYSPFIPVNRPFGFHVFSTHVSFFPTGFIFRLFCVVIS